MRVKAMKRKFYFITILLFTITTLNYKTLAQEEIELDLPISNINEIITQSGVEIDNKISKDDNGSLLVNAQNPITVELFDLDQENFRNKRLTYKAQMRSEDLKATDAMRGISYLELIALFPDGEELISRGPRVPISGTTDWRPVETVLYVDKGNTPEKIKLNLIVEGEGKVWIDNIKLEALPLRLNYLFWGHIVVWVVLIIYIYELFRKNRQLRKELETING